MNTSKETIQKFSKGISMALTLLRPIAIAFAWEFIADFLISIMPTKKIKGMSFPAR